MPAILLLVLVPNNVTLYGFSTTSSAPKEVSEEKRVARLAREGKAVRVARAEKLEEDINQSFLLNFS